MPVRGGEIRGGRTDTALLEQRGAISTKRGQAGRPQRALQRHLAGFG